MAKRNCYNCRRLFLVHGEAIWQPTRNRVCNLRIHRRPQRKSDIQGKYVAEQQDIQRPLQITFDPEVFPYEKLARSLLATNGPNGTPVGQFMDRGDSYRPVIFYHSEEQKRLRRLQSSLAKPADDSKDIVTKSSLQSTFLSCWRISPRFLQEGSQSTINVTADFQVATLLSTVFGNKNKSQIIIYDNFGSFIIYSMV